MGWQKRRDGAAAHHPGRIRQDGAVLDHSRQAQTRRIVTGPWDRCLRAGCRRRDVHLLRSRWHDRRHRGYGAEIHQQPDPVDDQSVVTVTSPKADPKPGPNADHHEGDGDENHHETENHAAQDGCRHANRLTVVTQSGHQPTIVAPRSHRASHRTHRWGAVVSSRNVRGHWKPGARGGNDLWYDEAAVLRLMGGDRAVDATSSERTEAVMRMTAAGLSSTVIASTLGCSSRTVTRHRRRAALIVAARVNRRRLVFGGQFAKDPHGRAWDLAGYQMIPKPYGHQYRWVRAKGTR